MRSRFAFLLALSLACAATAIFSEISAQQGWRPQPAAPIQLFDGPCLHNVFLLHPKVLSGGTPQGDAGFAKLQELGVRTIISVDGAKPELSLATARGMRYVHLPHGYNGVPESRAQELAKAVLTFEGPIYIHCHHGKHRSPAAAAVACVSAGLIAPEAAVPFLRAAGTSTTYRGLYESAASARTIAPELLDALSVEFKESQTLPPLAEAMVAIDQHFEALGQFAANRWRPLPSQPDLTASHEALLLREHLTELLRNNQSKPPSPSFRELLAEGVERSRELEATLLKLESTTEEVPPDQLSKRFQALRNNCSDCHAKFRDVPLTERNQP